MSNFLLRNQNHRLNISNLGAQILSWEVNTGPGEWENLLYTGSSVKRTGIPVLFPFADPLTDNIFAQTGEKILQHGFARDSVWIVQERTSQAVSLTLNQNQISSEMKVAYPFKFQVEIHLEILDDHILNYNLKVSNLGTEPMPIAPGLHPYFNLKHDDKTKLKIPNLESFDGSKFAWDEKLKGSFFKFQSPVEIYFPNGNIISISEKTTITTLDHLVIWSQPKNTLDFDFVCIEPFTRNTNALNDNPILIAPGESWHINLTFEFSQKK